MLSYLTSTRHRLLILLALAICGALAWSGTASAEPASLLFSVTTKDVRITGSGRTFTVSVPTRAQLAWFTDRPDRAAGASTASALVDGWHANGFDLDPPNAALVTSSHAGAMQTIVVLRSPKRADGRLSFRATVVPSGTMMGMRTTGRPRAGRHAGELFVDSATMSPCAAGGAYIGQRFAQCYTAGGYQDYVFYNDAADGTQLTYACGTGLSVHHYAPSPNATYALTPCPSYTNVGWATRHSGSNYRDYGQNSYVGVPPGVTFTFSFDTPCDAGTSVSSGTYTCYLPAGTSTSITRPVDGNTRVNACGPGGPGSLTYDSTAAGVRAKLIVVTQCDGFAPLADVPTTASTVVVHASSDIKLLVNAG